MDFSDSSTFSTASGKDYHYVVLQVTLKEKFLGTGSGNLTELEEAINHQAQKGYRLHTITTSNGGSKGLMGGDCINRPYSDVCTDFQRHLAGEIATPRRNAATTF